ncbi:probable jasmonic acid carboxyl methyltransferase 2 [Aristolochia californica]|uniref:probable jasmonic acid carboxyl methyltransferase 2 n=1 Tax=Aristolochia californica TaxID=171875 RepID=UPI0035DD295C
MEIQKILHMVGGLGENSYANNSSLQRVAITKVKPIVEKTILDLYSSMLTETLGIGDLGCSSGPNTLLVISDILDAIDWGSRRLKRPVPELKVFLNDLPGNDFNAICQSLPNFYEKLRKEKGEGFKSCYISAVPGSFYGRLFPKRSLHFIHSSYSLQWLSQVPPELTSSSIKGNIYLTETSPPLVYKAYLEQFKRDFQSFLQSRSEEIVLGGKMVLILLGRRTADPSSTESCYIWKLLGQALYDLVSRGLIDEAKLDAFNLPYYAPSVEELKDVIEKEGSFHPSQLDTMQVNWDGSEDGDEAVNSFDHVESGLNTAKIMRAVAEPILVSHFEAELMDEVFRRYGEIVAEHLSSERTKHVNLLVTLTRRG